MKKLNMFETESFRNRIAEVGQVKSENTAG
jgi:hypothetical protein